MIVLQAVTFDRVMEQHLHNVNGETAFNDQTLIDDCPSGSDFRPGDGAASPSRCNWRDLAAVPPLGRWDQMGISSARAESDEDRRRTLGSRLPQSPRL